MLKKIPPNTTRTTLNTLLAKRQTTPPSAPLIANCWEIAIAAYPPAPFYPRGWARTPTRGAHSDRRDQRVSGRGNKTTTGLCVSNKKAKERGKKTGPSLFFCGIKSRYGSRISATISRVVLRLEGVEEVGGGSRSDPAMALRRVLGLPRVCARVRAGREGGGK
ncbi:hypothetical protein BS50DRAFT_264661 [Corynespora cassiicola Philippines]|uniref:Uncharacterized protein n=1 Tax=Corynespora cassiicola Philippines TaxID=1448308 RepID=A0A2T2NZA1_CORCC|nr:hypothetical protein BS50DRAFT_264661 [Corynespora cassiicola Philippines]